MMHDIEEWFCMNKSEIKNSADMFLYKAIVDLNSGTYLLKAFNEDEIECDSWKSNGDNQKRLIFIKPR